MKLYTHAVGKISVVVLDQHRGMHRYAATTPGELWTWLQARDQDADPGTAFGLDACEWTQVVTALDKHGSVHVESECDCDLVVTRHLR